MTVSVYQQTGLHLQEREIARYLGLRGQAPDEALKGLMAEAEGSLKAGSYRVCYVRLPVQTDGSRLELGQDLVLQSTALARNLSGCREVVLFCTTVGPLVDRGILANRLRPSRALVWDAAGTAAIEQLCDDFCAWLPRPQRPRFSPGYGDLPLSCQKDILKLLDAERLLGVRLTDSLLMTPCKSVTAFVGLDAEVSK